MIQGPFSFLASFKDYKLHLCHVHHLSVSHGYLLLVVAADTESVTINATLPLPILHFGVLFRSFVSKKYYRLKDCIYLENSKM